MEPESTRHWDVPKSNNDAWVLVEVHEDIRIEEDQFKAGGEPIAHIRQRPKL